MSWNNFLPRSKSIATRTLRRRTCGTHSAELWPQTGHLSTLSPVKRRFTTSLQNEQKKRVILVGKPKQDSVVFHSPSSSSNRFVITNNGGFCSKHLGQSGRTSVFFTQGKFSSRVLHSGQINPYLRSCFEKAEIARFLPLRNPSSDSPETKPLNM